MFSDSTASEDPHPKYFSVTSSEFETVFPFPSCAFPWQQRTESGNFIARQAYRGDLLITSLTGLEKPSWVDVYT